MYTTAGFDDCCTESLVISFPLFAVPALMAWTAIDSTILLLPGQWCLSPLHARCVHPSRSHLDMSEIQAIPAKSILIRASFLCGYDLLSIFRNIPLFFDFCHNLHQCTWDTTPYLSFDANFHIQYPQNISNTIPKLFQMTSIHFFYTIRLR